MIVENAEQLHELYGLPSGRAKNKQLTLLDKHALNFIKTSPFLILSTFGKNGKLDASPRGGKPGFVSVINNREVAIPDAKGNNRVDSLINIVETGRIGMLFLIPGVDETLRLNGKAHITTDLEYLSKFKTEIIPPKSCIVITVEEVFLHCAKALMRSKLWLKDYKIERAMFPTMGEMLKDQLDSKEPAETQEEMIRRYKKDL